MSRIIVTGSRHFSDKAWLWNGLDILHELLCLTEVIEGGATGADLLAGQWADLHAVKHTTVKAFWTRYGDAAGPIRNVEMAKLKPDFCLIAPGGVGTASMSSIAKRYNIRRLYLHKIAIPTGGYESRIDRFKPILTAPEI